MSDYESAYELERRARLRAELRLLHALIALEHARAYARNLEFAGLMDRILMREAEALST